MHGLGVVPRQTVPPITVCPHCSYLSQSECVVCPDGFKHPGCRGCVGGEPEGPKWYLSDTAISIYSSFGVGIVLALGVAQLKYRTHLPL